MINADQILLRTIGLNYVGLNLSKKLQITKDAEGFDENNVRSIPAGQWSIFDRYQNSLAE